MEALQNKTSKSCAMEFVYDVLGQKWNLKIIHTLINEQYTDQSSMSYTDIAEMIPNISSKILAKRLRFLQEQDIIDVIHNEITPKKLRYSLSPLGKKLIPIVETLRGWSLSTGNYNGTPCNKGQCQHAVDDKRYIDLV